MIYPELLLQNRYRVIRKLGRGGLGETWEVDDGGTRKVLKVLRENSPKAVELFRREAEVLKQLNHPGIPKIDENGDFTFWPENGSVPNPPEITPDSPTKPIKLIADLPPQRPRKPLHCLVMEKIEGVDLQKWLGGRGNQPITQEQGIDWLKQVVEILAKVHEQQYFHRDIKPDNIMLRPNGQLVLIDFGAVRELTATYVRRVENEDVTIIYAVGYTAPEQIKGKASPQSDFFALGRTFVYLLTGKSPATFRENPETGRLLFWRDSAPQVSKGLADLIDDLMDPSPEKRPENAQVIWQRLAILSTWLSIESNFADLPRPIKFFAQQIFRHESQRWMKQIKIPKIALYGRSGSGKSSLINAILGERFAAVSIAKPGTSKPESYRYYRQGWELNFVDSRGVGDSGGDAAFKQAIDSIVNKKVDILLFVIPADERNVYQDVEFLAALKVAHKQKHGAELPIILVLNKIDRLPPVREWNPPYNLSLDSITVDEKPKSAKHRKKEATIRECIKARTEEYQTLTDIYVPVCALWDDCEDERYNINELVLKIYKCLPDEATKNGFGGARADQSLKKAIAIRFTSAAARLAFFLFVVFPHTHTLDSNAVLKIQKGLVSMIAQIAGTNEDKSRAADKLLKQLGIQPTNLQPTNPKTALSMTFAIGEAATRCFIEKEQITQVQQTYTWEEERLEPKLQEAFKGGQREILNKMKEIDAEMYERYGVKPI
ncbi:MAG: protein kinase [Xenococcaceae cyanobacterium]